MGLPLSFLPDLPPFFPLCCFHRVLKGDIAPVILLPCSQVPLPPRKTASCVALEHRENSDGLTPGSLQDGELILPPQPRWHPQPDGPWRPRLRPAVMHPSPCQQPDPRCTCLSRQGRAYSVHQWFLHLCLYVPSARWGCRTFTCPRFSPFDCYTPPAVCSPKWVHPNLSMLNHSGVGAFRPLASTEDRESYQSAFTPAKRLKNCHDTQSPPPLALLRCRWQEYDFGTQLPSSSPVHLRLTTLGRRFCCLWPPHFRSGSLI